MLWGGVSVVVILGGTYIWIVSQSGASFEGHADCGVIFGAAVWQDDKPSHALYDRIMAGVDLYDTKKIDCLVLSGGASKLGSHEVDVMKQVLIENNIPEEILRFDYSGTNTQKTLDHLPHNVDSWVMISNDFHLARIRTLAWKLGVQNVSLHAAPYRQGRYLKEPYFRFREVAGVLYTLVMVW